MFCLVWRSIEALPEQICFLHPDFEPSDIPMLDRPHRAHRPHRPHVIGSPTTTDTCPALGWNEEADAIESLYIFLRFGAELADLTFS